MAHASHKVAVGGGDAALAFAHAAHMAAQAGAAGGRGDGAACVDKDLGQAFGDAVQVNLLGGRNDDAAHAVLHLAALHNFGGNAHVADAAVGAAADDHLVDGQAFHLVHSLGV